MKKFQISTDGVKTLVYEDCSCKAICNVADFRDLAWWIVVIKVFDKKNEKEVKLDESKELELYKRILYDASQTGMKEIYTTKFGFIKNIELEGIELSRTLI